MDMGITNSMAMQTWDLLIQSRSNRNSVETRREGSKRRRPSNTVPINNNYNHKLNQLNQIVRMIDVNWGQLLLEWI